MVTLVSGLVWLVTKPNLKIFHNHTQEGQRLIVKQQIPYARHHQMGFDETPGQEVIQFTTLKRNLLYIRMTVRNVGFRTANRCRGFLVNIEYESQGQRRRIFYDSIPLGWSYVLDDSNQELHVPKGVWLTLDIFYTCKGEKQFFPCLKPLPDDYCFDQIGKYYLTVLVSAENARARMKTLELEWKQDWNDFEVDGYKVTRIV